MELKISPPRLPKITFLCKLHSWWDWHVYWLISWSWKHCSSGTLAAAYFQCLQKVPVSWVSTNRSVWGISAANHTPDFSQLGKVKSGAIFRPTNLLPRSTWHSWAVSHLSCVTCSLTAIRCGLLVLNMLHIAALIRATHLTVVVTCCKISNGDLGILLVAVCVNSCTQCLCCTSSGWHSGVLAS